MMVARMASQRTIISINAPPGLCRPKKMIDQRVLSASWRMKMVMAAFTFLRSDELFHMRNAAMPMRANNIVQTGPKSQFGGAMAGLASVAYQVEIDDTVNMEPIMPASSEITMAMISFK